MHSDLLVLCRCPAPSVRVTEILWRVRNPGFVGWQPGAGGIRFYSDPAATQEIQASSVVRTDKAEQPTKGAHPNSLNKADDRIIRIVALQVSIASGERVAAVVIDGQTTDNSGNESAGDSWGCGFIVDSSTNDGETWAVRGVSADPAVPCKVSIPGTPTLPMPSMPKP